MDYLTIGKMAKMNNISEQTLRLYDKKGLLVPCEINEETGYRYYNIKQCAQLDMIQYMKSLNMSLSQIKDCFDESDDMQLREILHMQKENLRNQMVELQHAEWAVDRAIQSYKRFDSAPKEDTPILEFQEERSIFLYDTNINCYSYGMEYYENILRNLKQQYNKHNLPMSYFCNVGSILRKEYFMKKELFATEVLLFVDESLANIEEVETIPEGVYLCVYCNGFQKEEESLMKLMDYIEENNYEVTGDCISEILIEFPTFTHYDRNAFFKLQVPIE